MNDNDSFGERMTVAQFEGKFESLLLSNGYIRIHRTDCPQSDKTDGFVVHRSSSAGLLFGVFEGVPRIYFETPYSRRHWYELRAAEAFISRRKHLDESCMECFSNLFTSRYEEFLNLIDQINKSSFLGWRLRRFLGRNTQTYSEILSHFDDDPAAAQMSFKDLIESKFTFLLKDYGFAVKNCSEYDKKNFHNAELAMCKDGLWLLFSYDGRDELKSVSFCFSEFEAYPYALEFVVRLVDNNADVFYLPTFSAWSCILEKLFDKIDELLSKSQRTSTMQKLPTVPVPDYPQGLGDLFNKGIFDI